MQSVSSAFKDISTASFNNPVHNLKISWLRNNNASADFAAVGTSLIGGVDIVQGAFSEITPTDLFEYFDESDYVLSLECERILEEPLGGVSYAQAKVQLENTSKRFTGDFNSTIGTAILPKRPMQIQMGYKVNAIDKPIPKFKGIISMRPAENKENATIELNAFDYISFLDGKNLESSIYQNQRSDQIISNILQSAGFSSGQYDLDVGLNTIGFAWFTKNQTAGMRIRHICEAEEANFYQDENGVIRFENRRKFLEAPFDASVHNIDSSDIIAWQELSDTQRINRCIVIAKPRKAGSKTTVWESFDASPIPPGGNKVIFASFEDPLISVETPVAGLDYLANSALDGSGSETTNSISISVDLFTTEAKLTITNNSGLPAFLVDSTGNPFFKLRGIPAIVNSEITEIYEDLDAQEAYGEVNQFVVENDFIDSDSFAYYLARAIVRKYKDGIKRIRVTVPAVPHLQLKDKVVVEDPYTATTKNYRVMAITDKQRGAAYIQDIILREAVAVEADQVAVVGVSAVNGDHVVWI